jgi:hypothetical protein
MCGQNQLPKSPGKGTSNIPHTKTGYHLGLNVAGLPHTHNKGEYMRIFLALSLALTLAACGTSSADPSASPSDSTSPTSSFSPVPTSELVPQSCEETGLLELMNSKFTFKKLAYIPAPENYVPTADTPIYPVLTNGGAVCVTANNEEQFGMYVFWTPDADGAIFDEQVAGWETAGYKAAEIPGVSSDRQLVLIKEPTDSSPDQGVSATFVQNGIWIRIDAFWGPEATFDGSLTAMKPIIEKVIAVIS